MKHSHTKPFLHIPNILSHTKDSLASCETKKRLIDRMGRSLQYDWSENVTKFRCYKVIHPMLIFSCSKFDETFNLVHVVCININSISAAKFSK